jgi:glycosyltransferase involved in cell wall biosynthesis
VLGFDGPVCCDLSRLPSLERRLAAACLGPAEQAGLATEVEHLTRREARLLARSTAVVCDGPALAAAVRDLAGTGVPVTVVPPTTVPPVPALPPPVPGSGGGPGRRAPAATVALPGRFSDEFATPDESAVPVVLDEVLPAAGVAAADVAVCGEDTVPLLRRCVAHRVRTVDSWDSWDVASSSAVALDLRTAGGPTTARRAELVAAGVPVVTSRVALGGGEPGELGDRSGELLVDDPAAAAVVLRRLLGDPDARDAVVAAYAPRVAALAPGATRPALAAALAPALAVLGLGTSNVGAGPRAAGSGTDGSGGVDAALATTEQERRRRDGTLADADPRIEELEAAMVPLRLHTRDDSINLQSPIDADQRYRVYARTHLEAPPATEPPAPPGPAPTFSVLVPTWNSDPGLLAACLDSVAAQTWPHWELCVVDDGSTRTDHLDLLRERAAADPRVRVQANPWNQGIARASNDALAMATGEWVVLLDHDDVLKPDALAWVATYVDRCPDRDVWYSDEDKLDPSGRLVLPFFKPDWSPDLLMGVNYVCHLLAARRALVEDVGGFRAGFDGAQDYDLVLRLVERARRVGHIAKPLYSWRMVPGSTALDTGAKPAAHHAGHRALVEALARRDEPATVEDGWADTTHRVRYAVDTEQLLTVVIPTRDRVDLMRRCTDRLAEAGGGVRMELLVVDNQSTDPATLAYLDDLVAAGHQVVRYPHEFSFARQINLGVLHARGDLVLVLNNDTWARDDDWLLRMMEHAQRPDVGLVGCKLVFPEGMRDARPQHEGIVLGMAGLAYNIDLGGYMGLDQFVRDCSSVTAAAVMARPSVLLGVGMLEERLRVAYNDVDLGVRISEFGHRVVYTPHAVLEHPESASRGDLHPMDDEDWLVHRWGPKGAVREPFVSPHFEWLMPVFYRL